MGRLHKRSNSYTSQFVRVYRLIPEMGILRKNQKSFRGSVDFDHMSHKPYALSGHTD